MNIGIEPGWETTAGRGRALSVPVASLTPERPPLSRVSLCSGPSAIAPSGVGNPVEAESRSLAAGGVNVGSWPTPAERRPVGEGPLPDPSLTLPRLGSRGSSRPRADLVHFPLRSTRTPHPQTGILGQWPRADIRAGLLGSREPDVEVDQRVAWQPLSPRGARRRSRVPPNRCTPDARPSTYEIALARLTTSVSPGAACVAAAC